MTLEAVVAQFLRMDAHLDTLSDELCYVNTYVGRIARWQAHLNGFVESLSPSPEASEDKDDDGDSDDDVDEDEDASSSDDGMITAWFTYPLSFMTKRGSSFRYESSHVHRGGVCVRDFG